MAKHTLSRDLYRGGGKWDRAGDTVEMSDQDAKRLAASIEAKDAGKASSNKSKSVAPENKASK